MATNPHFRNYTSPREQLLQNNLVVESIQIGGLDIYYVTRRLGNEDKVLNDSTYTIFDRAFLCEMYLKTYDGFGGGGDFMSKFGIPEINDQMTLSVAIRSFEKNITSYANDIKRPREGDILYFPLNKKFFEVVFVEHENVFYQSGKLHVYDIKCELLNFDNQKFETGLDFIDDYSVEFETDNVDTMEELFDKDPISKNLFFEEEQETLIDDSEFDPFKDIMITSLKKG